MTDRSNERKQFSPTALRLDNIFHGVNAATLGTACLLLAAACIGVIFWNSDIAVQSGATLLGVSLASSGLISLLAGDQ